jgi:hypothetical protein
MDWRCKMADGWKKLESVQYEAPCIDCKKMIHHGETAWWLITTRKLLHPGCGCGLGSKPISDLLPIYTENPTYDKNPFENILGHTPGFYAAKEWRASLDN